MLSKHQSSLLPFVKKVIGQIRMKPVGQQWVAALICVVLLEPGLAESITSLESLLDDEKFEIKTWIEPDDNIVVSQQIKLHIEVSTNRKLTGGTQIGRLEIDDAVVLRREKFAVNSTRRRDDETWVVQQWTLTIYPQRAGSFEVPRIPLTLFIAGKDERTITGTTTTQAVSFQAFVPTEMSDKQNWLATTVFEVEESYDKESGELKPGDSLTRTIRFKSQDVAAMMLPAIDFKSIDGLAVYQKPSRVKDKVNRGEYLAERIESVTYLIERAGEFRLQEMEFYWWDLSTGEMKSVVLPERVVATALLSVEESFEAQTQEIELEPTNILKLKIGAVLLIFLALIFLIWRVATKRIKQSSSSHNRPALKSLQKQYVEACRVKNYSLAVSILYAWVDHPNQEAKIHQAGPGSIRVWLNNLGNDRLGDQFDQLMRLANGAPSGGDGEFSSLLASILKHSNTHRQFTNWWSATDLRLN